MIRPESPSRQVTALKAGSADRFRRDGLLSIETLTTREELVWLRTVSDRLSDEGIAER